MGFVALWMVFGLVSSLDERLERSGGGFLETGGWETELRRSRNAGPQGRESAWPGSRRAGRGARRVVSVCVPAGCGAQLCPRRSRKKEMEAKPFCIPADVSRYIHRVRAAQPRREHDARCRACRTRCPRTSCSPTGPTTASRTWRGRRPATTWPSRRGTARCASTMSRRRRPARARR